MEEMSLEGKLTYLRQHNTYKCQKKRELLKEHQSTWKVNGLHDLNYHSRVVIKSEALHPHCIKITVNVLLNERHWTNDEAGMDFVN